MKIVGEVITIRGDGISLERLIARKTRNYMPGYVERVLDLNPGIAGLGPLLPVGTKVTIPAPTDVEVANKVEVIRLWE